MKAASREEYPAASAVVAADWRRRHQDGPERGWADSTNFGTVLLTVGSLQLWLDPAFEVMNADVMRRCLPAHPWPEGQVQLVCVVVVNEYNEIVNILVTEGTDNWQEVKGA